MSKIGRLPITVQEGIQVSIADNIVKVSGPKGASEYMLPRGIKVTMTDGKLVLNLENEKDTTKSALYGLARASLANVVKGVQSGFEKKLELVGVGYRAQMQGTDLVLSLGFSHQVKFRPDQNVNISVAENVITITGIDKALVGETAAKIRGIKPPEPYKGKGIKYKGEQIRRKAGKAAKAVGGAK